MSNHIVFKSKKKNIQTAIQESERLLVKESTVLSRLWTQEGSQVSRQVEILKLKQGRARNKASD